MSVASCWGTYSLTESWSFCWYAGSGWWIPIAQPHSHLLFSCRLYFKCLRGCAVAECSNCIRIYGHGVRMFFLAQDISYINAYTIWAWRHTNCHIRSSWNLALVFPLCFHNGLHHPRPFLLLFLLGRTLRSRHRRSRWWGGGGAARHDILAGGWQTKREDK